MHAPAQTFDAAFDAYLAGWQPSKFSWEDAHCGTFAAGWVTKATGRDALAGLRSHTTLRAWKGAVQGDMAELVTRQLGTLPVLATLAQRGDVVLFEGDVTGGALAICAGRTAVGLNSHGACLHLPMAEARCAWPLREVKP
jgi:hypothetical protein